jgi:phosphoserine phosphatase
LAIARLIADENELKTRLQMARATLAERGVAVGEPEPGPGEAILTFSHASAGFLLDAMDHLFTDCDWIVAEKDIRPVALMVSDMDSTIIGQECIDELADYAGLKDQIAAITEKAMLGEIDFEGALRGRVALLAGLDVSAIDRCLAERIRPNQGAGELVSALKASGARTVLVTGGFHHFADAIADQLGFDRVVGNRLGVKSGKLTGELEGPVSDAATKARVLTEESAKLGEGAVTLAIGDGANDIPMIEAATHGIAYKAKPRAKAAADGRIESGDLARIVSLLRIGEG